ncbi:male sterility protein-domain-containing protein [Polychytrium aggregatum]|uniref:male sterility protein-domain-containing protein n=1 Tax=Polychytrium aggregatum TaxID=110093 RepID=UPI0022FDEFE4|nr:male sterility protein-domain-containing protein [Polychytrium aggregatum]KAI9204642.1 male sterility protein-domain-containing protein [Polychytrium aggregatum]
MVFKMLSCCFGSSDDSPSDRGIPGTAAPPVSAPAMTTLLLPDGEPAAAAAAAVEAGAEADVDAAAESAASAQQPKPAMAAYDPWMHPVEAIIKMAQNEPHVLAAITLENGKAERYSYLQLWEKAYSIAQGLKALPGWNDEGHDVVATFCEPEVHWMFYSVALWILGKKVINFALNWPSSVRKAICDRLKIRYVLYHHTKPGRVEGLEPIDAGAFPLLDSVPAPSLEACEPLNDYIVYLSTSGTTGIPKTYPVPHRFVEPSRGVNGLEYTGSGVLQSPSFTTSMGLILGMLNTRGSLWFTRPTPNPQEKAQGIIELLDEGMTSMYTTPSLCKLIFKTAQSKKKTVQWNNVLVVGLGSELVSASLVSQTKTLCPNAFVHLMYGSSETGVIGAMSACILPSSAPSPSQVVYKQPKPNVRCLLFDEEGNTVDQSVSKSGILVLAVDKDDPIKDHPNFTTANPNDKLASFGFLSDGSPRVCTMDWVEMTGESEFTVIGRFGQKVKVNGVYVDLNALEEMVNQDLSEHVADCIFIQTSELKIVMLYVPQKGSTFNATPGEIIQMTENLFALKNVAKVPIRNCLELEAFPFNDSGKRDLKKLRHIAENIDSYGKSVQYPSLIIEDTPLSRTAAKISQIGSQILDNPALDGRNYYIGGVGFDSLSVGRLALAIKDEFDVEISPLILLSNGMTPTDVAQLVVDILDDKPLIPPTVDLAAEAAKLDDASVTAEGLPPFVYPKDPRGIVLTGATGFLGAFLIFELAHKFPRAKIYCVVRAQNEQLAFTRIFANASKLVIASRKAGDPRYDVRDRFIGLCGDLSKDKWGLSDERWKEISEETDMIVHNGAEVHWLFDYDRLRGPNVLSTATALRLATTHHLKPLHYISTIGTIPMAKKADKPLEEKIYSAWNISGGYSQTKWVSEQLINKARSRGVPVTIIRPAVIAGDSKYGVSNSDDYIWRYVKGCIQLGVAPSHATPVTMTMDPVDHVAKVVAEIAGSEESLSKFVFHISDSEHSALTETKLFEIVKAFGWTVLFESREQFKFLLTSNPSAANNSLFPLMHTMMDMSVKLDNANTRSIYPTPGVSTTVLAKKCLSYLYHVGFLPKPENPSSELKDEEYPEVSIFGRTGRN